MAKTGKVYENMMINLAPSNEKLKKRVVRITREIIGCSEDKAIEYLNKSEWSIRRAIAIAEKE
jgi:N-acetylmuramic acid 6-phosphate etherase